MVIVEISEDAVDERSWCVDGRVGTGGEYRVFCAITGGGENWAAAFGFAGRCERGRKGDDNEQKDDT